MRILVLGGSGFLYINVVEDSCRTGPHTVYDNKKVHILNKKLNMLLQIF